MLEHSSYNLHFVSCKGCVEEFYQYSDVTKIFQYKEFHKDNLKFLNIFLQLGLHLHSLDQIFESQLSSYFTKEINILIFKIHTRLYKFTILVLLRC